MQKEIHKSSGRIRNKRMCFEIRIVLADDYPDLMVNPTNEYTTMSDDDRFKTLIDTVALMQADAKIDKTNSK